MWFRRHNAKIFISYRRDDSAGHAGRVYQSLEKRFKAGHIFMDVDGIGAGEDFVEVIERNLNSSNVFIVIIGKQWATIADKGEPRLYNPDDYVRIEVSKALKRGVPVIPVLVQGAVMPSPDELPEELKPLVRRQAIEISDARWSYDVERLIKRVQQLLPSRPSASPAALAGVVLIMLTLGLGVFLYSRFKARTTEVANTNNNISTANNATTPVSNNTTTTNTPATNTPTPNGNTGATPTPAITPTPEDQSSPVAQDETDKELIILHSTATPITVKSNNLENYLRQGRKAHYLILRNGEVRTIVEETERANHITSKAIFRGEPILSGNSLGIELEHDETGNEEYPEPQIAALVNLLSDIAKRKRLEVERILSHSEVQSGRSELKGLDMNDIRRRVNDKLQQR